MTKHRPVQEEAVVEQSNDPSMSKGPASDDRAFSTQVAKRARRSWPRLRVDMDAFVAHVSSFVDCELPPSQTLDGLAVEDLYLAYACSKNDPAALKAFARQSDDELRVLRAKVGFSSGDFDDLRQSLWNKLFLPSGAHPPKILKYAGKGRLRLWFRVLATRTILDGVRKAKTIDRISSSRDTELEQAAAMAVADPELANIRRHYRGAFRAAFETAVNALDAQERNILKCHYIRGMSTDQLARAFGVHKATAARHVARARERLLELTRSHLKANLGADSRELNSVMRLFDGEMSVSLSRLFE